MCLGHDLHRSPGRHEDEDERARQDRRVTRGCWQGGRPLRGRGAYGLRHTPLRREAPTVLARGPGGDLLLAAFWVACPARPGRRSMSTEDILFPKFDYYLEESDPDIAVLRRQDGSFVAAFSVRGATKEGIVDAAKEDYRELLRVHRARQREDTEKEHSA
jgi:hypothetical protein